MQEVDHGSNKENTPQEAFQPFQGLGDGAKDKDLYGPLALISVKGDLDMEVLIHLIYICLLLLLLFV